MKPLISFYFSRSPWVFSLIVQEATVGIKQFVSVCKHKIRFRKLTTPKLLHFDFSALFHHIFSDLFCKCSLLVSSFDTNIHGEVGLG